MVPLLDKLMESLLGVSLAPSLDQQSVILWDYLLGKQLEYMTVVWLVVLLVGLMDDLMVDVKDEM